MRGILANSTALASPRDEHIALPSPKSCSCPSLKLVNMIACSRYSCICSVKRRPRAVRHRNVRIRRLAERRLSSAWHRVNSWRVLSPVAAGACANLSFPLLVGFEGAIADLGSNGLSNTCPVFITLLDFCRSDCVLDFERSDFALL